MDRINLNKLVLDNTGVHEHLELTFGKATVIQAKNAKGKTTVENAIIALLEGKYKNLVSSGETEGKIMGFFSDNISMVLPLKSDSKQSPTIIENGESLKKPRALLDEWNTHSLKVNDFFAGSGAELEKNQVETLLKLIKISLSPDEVKAICGELPLESEFKALHPLDYIKRLVNEKDGFYYAERAKNTANIQTTNHAMLGLRDRVIEVFNKYQISIDAFNPIEWENISLSETAVKIHEIQKSNEIYLANKKFVDEYPAKLAEMQEQKEMYLKSKHSEFMNAIKDEQNELTQKEIAKGKNIFEVSFGRYESIDAFYAETIRQIEIIQSSLNRWRDEAIENLCNTEDMHDVDNNIEIYRTMLDEKIDKFSAEYEVASAYVINNALVNVDEMLLENSKVESIQKIIPTYKEFKKMESEYEDRKARSEEYNTIIDNLRKLPKVLLQRAEMPIRNLSMNEDKKFVYMTAKGKKVYLDQLSGWEQTQVSYDVAIASMGRINLLIISEWSEIDPDNQKTTINYFIEKGVNLLAIGISNDETLQVKTYNEVIK